MSGETACSKMGESEPTNQDFLDSLGQMATDMGMDETCVKAAESASASASASYEADMLGLAKAGGQMSMTAQSSSMEESGCGQFIMNASSIFDSQTNMTCNLSSTASSSVINAAAGASITIKTLAMTDNDVAALNSLTASISALSFLVNDNPALQTTIDSLNATMQTITNRSVDITDSTLTATSSTDINSAVSVTSSNESSLISDYQNIAQIEAEQTLESTMGFQALTTDQKQVISNQVEKQLTNVSENISDVINSTKIDSTSDTDITIEAAGAINLTNVTIDASAYASVVSQLITQNAMNAGQEIATSILTDLATTQGASQEGAGVDSLVDALGEANAAAIEANDQSVSMAGTIIGAILFFGIFILAGYFMVKVGGGVIPPIGSGDPKKLAVWVVGFLVMIVVIILLVWLFRR
jgi:hypothetical protein